MKVVYANCLGTEACDVLATDEPLVAAAADSRVIVPDAGFDADEAQALNERTWRLGFEWARTADADPTEVDGVSAADLAGIEATLTVLLPAVRGVLEADALLAQVRPERLITAAAASEDAGYTRVETTLCAAVAATVSARIGVEAEHRVVADARNAPLIAKYAATRNPPSAADENRRAARLTALASAGINAAARLRAPRGRDSVMVVEYNPTAVVARRWHALTAPDAPALVRSRFVPADLPAMLRHGQRAFALPRARPGAGAARVEAAIRGLDVAALGDRFAVRGVDLAPVVVPALSEIAVRYARWAEGRVRATRRRLRRQRVRALLVPYDSAPSARVVLRAAQAEGIPTAVLNNGWQGDDHSPDGMTADHAFALSASVRDGFFARRHDAADVVVTGDPRNDLMRTPPPRRDGGDVLVGSLTFSPSDLNCRRGDGERLLDEVLAGIAASRLAGRRVTVKLHPADRAEHYAPVLARHAALDVDVVATGDVLDMFSAAAVYITTYSTSLLSAALAGTPFVYYRVNEQRLYPPFSADPVMERRTAGTPAALAELLDAPPGTVDPAWVERHIGPRDGHNSQRVVDALLGLVR